MTGGSWGAAALVCLHLSSVGALPKEVGLDEARPYAGGARPVRVLVAAGCSSIVLRPQSDLWVEAAGSGRRLATMRAGSRAVVKHSGGHISITAPGVHVAASRLRIGPAGGGGGAIVSASGGWGRRGLYPGVLDIAAVGAGLRVVQQVDLETYIGGVVAAEMPSGFPAEAMKAQAIAARTYALQHLGGHDSDDADVCARVHCQAYAGSATGGSTAALAARQTAGQVLAWNGVLVDALYHSACGGATAPAWEVRQGKLLPYLAGSPDVPDGRGPSSAYCSQDHDLAWTRRFSQKEAERLVSANLGRLVGEPQLSPRRLEGMRLTRSERSGRAQWLKVYTDRGNYRVRGDAIRWLFGDGIPGRRGLRSTAFDLTVERAAGGRPGSYTFHGRGHGHGLGLCQWGSRGRALSGQTAEEILARYYPGAALVDLRREQE